MKKRAVTLLTLLAVSASLMACGGSDATESSAENDAEQIEAEVTGQTENADTEEEEVLPEGKYRSELTNELIDDSLKDQRPIAVMVDNESIALPHYGLSHADVVYEMMNSTLNGRISFQKGHGQIDFWVRNALDKEYASFYFESMGNGFMQKGRPVQAGIELRCRF